MAKFKFGDKVVEKNDPHRFVYTVVGTDDNIPNDGKDLLVVRRRTASNNCDLAFWRSSDEFELVQPTEFHVGDVVRVRKDCTIGELADKSWSGCQYDAIGMLKDCRNWDENRTVTVSRLSLNDEGGRVVQLDTGPFIYPAVMFELVRRAPQPKEMTMEELETALGYPVKIIKGDADGNT